MPTALAQIIQGLIIFGQRLKWRVVVWIG